MLSDDDENDDKRHSQTNIQTPTNILAQDQRDINYKADELEYNINKSTKAMVSKIFKFYYCTLVIKKYLEKKI